VQATLPARRTFDRSALVYQAWSHLVASVIGGAFALLVLAVAILSRGVDTLSGLLLFNLGAAVCGAGASFLWASAITFRSAILLEGPVFRRLAVVGALGLAANEAAFAAVALLVRASSDELAYRVVVGSVVAGVAQFLVTFAGTHLWAYRVMLPAPERQILAGTDWESTTPTDVELISIAAGERQMTGFWRMRGWALAYFMTWGALLAYGWYATVVLGMTNGDGTARVVQAFQVIFSREPHLAALGFVWPPIPAFTNIPLIALLRPLGLAPFSATVMGTMYAAGAVVMFASTLRALGVNRVVTTLLAISLATNQYFYQTAAAGLSEPVLAFFLLASLRAYVAWLHNPQPSTVMYAGLACAGGMMCRYEAGFWTAAMAGALMITMYQGIPGLGFLRTPGAGNAAEARLRMTSAGWAFLAPTVFALLVWVILNQQIAGSPLYFLNGPGSTRMSPDTARLAGADLAAYSPQGLLVYHAYHSVSGVVIMFFDRVAFFSPLLLGVSALLIPLAASRRDYRTLGLFGIVWSITAFALITGYLGSLPPYQRYWYWLGPMGCVMAAWGIAGVRAWGLRVVVWVVVVILAFSPNVRTFRATYNEFNEFEPTAEERLQNALFTTPDLGTVAGRSELVREWKAVAAEVNQIPADKLILLDVANPGGPLLLYTQHIERFVTSTDTRYLMDVLPEPWLHAHYVIVPEPIYDVKTRSTLLMEWPGLWEGQRPWAKVVKEIPGRYKWRILELSPGPRGLQPRASAAGGEPQSPGFASSVNP